MAGIALTGLASGLDTSTMISQIIAAESTGRTVLANQQTQANARITKLTAIQTKLSSLQTATNAMSSVSNWLPTQSVASSDSTIATATRTGGAGAGSFNVQVLSLASSSQKTFSFTSLAFTGNPSCFSKPTVTATQITVQDANNNAGAAVDYPYTIVVTSNNTPYSSAPAGIGGNPGDPMIKNK